MTGVNVAYDDALLVHIERIAAGLGLSRPDYFRAIAEESVKAHEQGRAMFEAPPPPINLDHALVLASKVEQLCTEIDRQNRSWDKREKKLIDAFNLSEDTRRKTQERHGEELVALFRDGATPFAIRLSQLREDVVDLKAQILAAVHEPEALATIRADLTAMKAAFRRARREHHFHLFETWKPTGTQIGALSFVALIVVGIAQTWIASVLPSDWLASRLTLKMYGSADAAICELYEYSRHVERCPVLAPEKTAGKR